MIPEFIRIQWLWFVAICNSIPNVGCHEESLFQKGQKMSRLPKRIRNHLKKEATEWDNTITEESPGYVEKLLDKAESFKIPRPARQPVSNRWHSRYILSPQAFSFGIDQRSRHDLRFGVKTKFAPIFYASSSAPPVRCSSFDSQLLKWGHCLRMAWIPIASETVLPMATLRYPSEKITDIVFSPVKANVAAFMAGLAD